MSSLGMSLLILALIGVGGVLAYNLWLGGGLRRRGERPAGSAPEIAVVRPEPRVGSSSLGDSVSARADDAPGLPDAGYASSISDEDEAALPVLDERLAEPTPIQAEQPMLSAQDRALEAQGARATHPPARLDPLADCCVVVDLPVPVRGERLLALTRGFRRAGSKPVLVEASTDSRASEAPSATDIDDESEAVSVRDEGASGGEPAPQDPTLDHWRTPVAGQSYRALRFGVLMANRHGPLNAMEYSEFASGLLAIGSGLGLTIETPEMMGVLERARALDARCAALDAQIGVNVEAPQALSPADLSALATSADVVERGNNRYARLGIRGETIFSVALGETPNRLTFLLDVPRADPAHEPLREMVACAWDCAQSLQGRMVDDTGRALTDAVFQRIENQLGARYEELRQAGFPAGSGIALRLFN